VTGSISLATICLIIMIIAAMRVGVLWTLAIAIAASGVGIIVTLTGITVQIAHALNTAAGAFGAG
jgi:UPF0716 family protein affecting phage T7 exclusion